MYFTEVHIVWFAGFLFLIWRNIIFEDQEDKRCAGVVL
jgi:hypothetical protein